MPRNSTLEAASRRGWPSERPALVATRGEGAARDRADRLRRRAGAACLVINLVANRGASEQFSAARKAFATIAQYVLFPSMGIVVVSGLIALAATRSYANAGWAWVKALLGLSVFEATLLIVGSGRQQAELAAATVNPTLLDSLLRSERNTLWLLIAVSVANVVLAVWRPRLTVKVR